MVAKSGKPKIYVESSTISYLTARPARDIIINAKQELTRVWWGQRDHYELFISEAVLEEIAEGDPQAAEARLRIIQGITVIALDEHVERLARALLASDAVPAEHKLDAYHIAFAAVHKMDFLVTWNQKHIATEKKRRLIETIIEGFELKPPKLFTPEQHLIFEET